MTSPRVTLSASCVSATLPVGKARLLPFYLRDLLQFLKREECEKLRLVSRATNTFVTDYGHARLPRHLFHTLELQLFAGCGRPLVTNSGGWRSRRPLDPEESWPRIDTACCPDLKAYSDSLVDELLFPKYKPDVVVQMKVWRNGVGDIPMNHNVPDFESRFLSTNRLTEVSAHDFLHFMVHTVGGWEVAFKYVAVEAPSSKGAEFNQLVVDTLREAIGDDSNLRWWGRELWDDILRDNGRKCRNTLPLVRCEGILSRGPWRVALQFIVHAGLDLPRDKVTKRMVRVHSSGTHAAVIDKMVEFLTQGVRSLATALPFTKFCLSWHGDDWPASLPSAEAMIEECKGKTASPNASFRYIFTRTNAHSGERFELVLVGRPGDIRVMELKFEKK